jgi:hypothetical protein
MVARGDGHRTSPIHMSSRHAAGDHKVFCWRMTFLVEWCVTCAFSLMILNVFLPSLMASQAHSCIVGSSPCGCPRGWVGCPRAGLLYFSHSPAESFMISRPQHFRSHFIPHSIHFGTTFMCKVLYRNIDTCYTSNILKITMQ